MRRIRAEESNLLMVKLGQACKEQRLEKGISGKKFAEMLDVTTDHLGKFESGKTGVSLATLLRICVLLDVSIDSILFESNLSEDEKTLQQMRFLVLNNRENIPEMIKCLNALTRIFAATSAGEKATDETE